MHTFSSISSRFQRNIALVVLCSYSALVLLLAIHQHDYSWPGGDELQPVHTGAVPHGHTAAVCPLQYYLVFAFQAEPGTQQAPVVLHASHLVRPASWVHCSSFVGARLSSRAPPSLV
ncbi:MAG: hypothetical protein IH600_06115 [Bacteroidetes bacterium]|nr:hypothetical protein [Bacteroidota bacterium]